MHEFVVDLTAHERTRLAAVVEALDYSYDPAGVLAGEQEAHRLLYSNLSPHQQAVYVQLVEAGVL